MDYQRTYNKKPVNNQHKDYHRIYHARRKAMVMEKYGGKCIGCGETDLACLSIDHIQLMTKKDKLKTDGVGTSFYKQLLNAPRRNDLQVLCMNCQFKKRIYGPNISLWDENRGILENSIKNLKINIGKGWSNDRKNKRRFMDAMRSSLICPSS